MHHQRASVSRWVRVRRWIARMDSSEVAPRRLELEAKLRRDSDSARAPSGPIGAARMKIFLASSRTSQHRSGAGGWGRRCRLLQKISSFSTRRAVFKFCRQRGAPRRPHAPHAKGRNFFHHAGSPGEPGRSSRVNLVSLPSVARRLLMASVTVTTASLRVSATRPRCARLSLATLGATRPARAFLLRS